MIPAADDPRMKELLISGSTSLIEALANQKNRFSASFVAVMDMTPIPNSDRMNIRSLHGNTRSAGFPVELVPHFVRLLKEHIAEMEKRYIEVTGKPAPLDG